MKVIVTGAGGFVGGYVIRELVARGHEPVAVVRPRKALPAWLAVDEIAVVRANLTRPSAELEQAAAGAGAVIHLAAGTSGSPRERFDSTVLATESLIAGLRAGGFGGRFVHVSSLAVYAFSQLARGATIDERTPLEPELERRDDYAWTKVWQERVVRAANAAGDVEATIVRPGAIYGPERRFQQRLGRRVGERSLILVGGLNRMPLSYVENTASLLVECADNPRAAREVFNAIDPDPPRQWQYLRHLRRTEPLRVIPLPGPVFRGLGAASERAREYSGGAFSGPGMVDRYSTTPNLGSFRYDWTRPLRVLGWKPPVPRAEALRRTFSESRRASARGRGESGEPKEVLDRV